MLSLPITLIFHHLLDTVPALKLFRRERQFTSGFDPMSGCPQLTSDIAFQVDLIINDEPRHRLPLMATQDARLRASDLEPMFFDRRP